MKVEEHNLKEEIKEIVGKAIKSGISNENCSVFRVMREEQYSPRGKAIMLDNGIYERIVYSCNLCKACNNNIAGSNLCSAFQKARQVLVTQKKELSENKKMIKNLQESGNVYGINE